MDPCEVSRLHDFVQVVRLIARTRAASRADRRRGDGGSTARVGLMPPTTFACEARFVCSSRRRSTCDVTDYPGGAPLARSGGLRTTWITTRLRSTTSGLTRDRSARCGHRALASIVPMTAPKARVAAAGTVPARSQRCFGRVGAAGMGEAPETAVDVGERDQQSSWSEGALVEDERPRLVTQVGGVVIRGYVAVDDNKRVLHSRVPSRSGVSTPVLCSWTCSVEPPGTTIRRGCDSHGCLGRRFLAVLVGHEHGVEQARPHFLFEDCDPRVGDCSA